jgi:hypothetical protein
MPGIATMGKRVKAPHAKTCPRGITDIDEECLPLMNLAFHPVAVVSSSA